MSELPGTDRLVKQRESLEAKSAQLAELIARTDNQGNTAPIEKQED